MVSVVVIVAVEAAVVMTMAGMEVVIKTRIKIMALVQTVIIVIVST